MPSLPSNFVVFTGNANRGTAQEIAHYLGTTLGDADAVVLHRRSHRRNQANA